MRTILTHSAIALLIAAGGASFAPAVASAQDIELEFGREGPRLRLNDRCDPDFEDCRPDRRDRRERREERRAERGCTEDRALDKADRMGIRRARVVDAGRRTIDVRGRNRFGDRVIVTFGRQPGCPILR